MPSIDVPAVRGTVLAWALIWFVLGYTLYATVYGALGSLGSRVEDAQSVEVVAPGFPPELVDDEPEAPGAEVFPSVVA